MPNVLRPWKLSVRVSANTTYMFNVDVYSYIYNVYIYIINYIHMCTCIGYAYRRMHYRQNTNALSGHILCHSERLSLLFYMLSLSFLSDTIVDLLATRSFRCVSGRKKGCE